MFVTPVVDSIHGQYLYILMLEKPTKGIENIAIQQTAEEEVRRCWKCRRIHLYLMQISQLWSLMAEGRLNPCAFLNDAFSASSSCVFSCHVRPV